ncbi:host cell division inhibitor Icd-like protein [Salmonella enterica]|nr:host cell division inhibitor Icd-like protein [Salmonella enterica]MDJ7596023.1 host cell division inhibitor Icd-like protein [Salmonella enterica]
MAQISTSIAGGSLMTAIQNKAFFLAGLMYALRGIAYAHEDKAGITVPANASSSFSRRGNEESFETSTRTHGGEFLESIKKGLLIIADPVYGYSAPAKSGAGIGLPVNRMATHDAPSVFFCVVSSVHLFFSGAGIIRVARKIMVGCVGASSEAPVTIRAGKTNSAQSTTSKIGLFGGGLIPNRMEAAIMATIPTQNPQFIWLIAAVRRDIPTITAKIHHVSAESECEARRILARDHVCFFAGRIRQEVEA